jgi:hypothetical protein
MNILCGYGIGTNALCFIKEIWDMDTMIPKQAGLYGELFAASRGVRKRDIISPMIFNIVTDAIIRVCERQFFRCDPRRLHTIDTLFYADDGVIAGEEPIDVQYRLDPYIESFARVGLKMNAEETESLIMNGGKVCKAMSTHAYQRHT